VDINPSAQALTSLYPGAAIVDARERIVIPGFVNAHHHGESVLLRYVTRRAPYASWNALRGMFARLCDPASGPDIATLHRIAGFLHLKSGTTTVAEYPPCYTPAVLQGAIEQIAAAGLRSVVALQTWEQIKAFRSSPAGLRQFSISLGPEEAYTVYSFESLVRASAETQFPLAAHLAESRGEVEALRARFKKTPLRILKDTGALVPATHLIHCNHIPEKDLDLIADAGNPVTLCVRSTLSKQTGYPLIQSLASRDVAICLGTDWGETDLLGEIKLLRNLRKYFPGIPKYTPLELIRMATINGAHALGIASQTGSLEVGKIADLVMIPSNDIRLPALSMHPTAEEVAGIITDYCDSDMIADVMAQGVFRVWNGVAARVDGGEILRAFRQIQDAYLPPAGVEDEPGRSPGVPLVPPDRSEKNVFLAHGETEDDLPREKRANMSPPGAAADESPQKFPLVTKKIKKVFGENDI
jgi:5-methylthioadenosine/S-adenosylhomocysteine deaminase